jgi:hypothetical protein
MISQMYSSSTIGFTPVPFNTGTKKLKIACSTEASESPFSIPSAGISNPVYFTHLSETVSEHPL